MQLQKTTYEVKKTGTNIFAGIDIKEIVRRHEEEEKASEDSDDGADAFDRESDDMMLMMTSTKAMISPILAINLRHKSVICIACD